MSEPNWNNELFKFYTDGLVQWSLLLATSTVGVFAPLNILVTIHPKFYFEWALNVVYITFTLASGWCAGRLVGILFVLHKVMPEPLRRRHAEAVNLDPFALGPRVWGDPSRHHRFLVQYGLPALFVLVYMILLVSAVYRI